MSVLKLLIALVAALPLATAPAGAGEAEFDIDSRFRAKLAKEKVKQAAEQRQAQAEGRAANASGRCGSQSIGNIDTGGRPGTAPREVFIFAPNAINLVSGSGCR